MNVLSARLADIVSYEPERTGELEHISPARGRADRDLGRRLRAELGETLTRRAARLCR